MAAVTYANMRMSLVAGTAFVDFSAAGALSPYLGAQLTITDSAAKTLVGYIKAAGTGETYGDELMPNGGFDSDTTGWIPNLSTLASVAGGQSGNCLEITCVSGTVQEAYRYPAGVSGTPYRVSTYAKSGSSGNETATLVYGPADGVFYTAAVVTSAAWQQIVIPYALVDRDVVSIYLDKSSATPGTMLFDTASLRQILTPSATGVTIVSTPGGGTRSWTSEATGFARNDAAGYTYTLDASPASRKAFPGLLIG